MDMNWTGPDCPCPCPRFFYVWDFLFTLILATSLVNSGLISVHSPGHGLSDIPCPLKSPGQCLCTTLPMNIHIADSKDEAYLIGGDWLNRYQADISYSKKEITFRAQGQKFIVKLTTSQPKQKVNYLGTGRS